MLNYLLKALVFTSIILLSACQKNTNSNSLANIFSFPTPPSALNLAQSVQNALKASGDPIIAGLNVQTEQNIVFISGYVKKIRQSDVAEQIVSRVPGVQQVVNRIIVRH